MDSSKTLSNIESNELQKLPYPKRVFLIIGNEFCERFNYYGMKVILVLYSKYKLGYSEDDATVLFHTFTMTAYFMCVFGGILSDVWLGKFRTILYLSIIYSFGSALLSISSITNLNFSPNLNMIIGLSLIALGSGGIKPCVSAFGADQFEMPQQAALIPTFFAMFFFAVGVGSLISTTVTPILRADVHCFGQDDCFPLAFGVPSVLMFTSIVLFLIGKRSYTYENKSSENMLMQVVKCTMHAIKQKVRRGHEHSNKKLLDYSIDRYGEQLVHDTKVILQIVLLYLPLPVFWTLFDQKGSRWTFQATRMNGDIGFYTIKPDQMHLVHSLGFFILVPFFQVVVYPVISRIGIQRPLQKMTIGGILAAIAYLCTALVQLRLDSLPVNSMSMLWQVPQYVFITMAEVMFSVTGLMFSYQQAPEKMKSVVAAVWLLTEAFGNLLIIVITKMSLFSSQVQEILFFSCLMIASMIIFAFIARNFESNSQIQNKIEAKPESKY